jgi:UPF0271 protein
VFSLHPPRIDLNADVGEACGQDEALIRHITSANVACGAHAGNSHLMRETVRIARDCGVAVGAHPGFADREGFGRRDLGLSPSAITDLVVAQIRELAAIASAEGVRLQHVKPHGALFNVAVKNRSVADAIASATASADPSLILFGLPGSQLIAAADAAGLRAAREVFADRAYHADGTLVPRSVPGAVIDDPDQVVARVVGMVAGRSVEAIDGRRVPLDFDTICVHGDTPGAALLAGRIRAALIAAGVTIRSLGA